MTGRVPSITPPRPSGLRCGPDAPQELQAAQREADAYDLARQAEDVATTLDRFRRYGHLGTA